MESHQSPIDKISNSPQFKSFMNKLATFGILLTVAGSVMKLSGVQTGETLLIAGAGILSIVSIFLGRIFPCPFHVGEALWKFSMTLTGFASAVVIMGLLFVVMHWPGGIRMLILGLGSLAICAVAWLFFLRYYRKNRDIKVFEEQDERSDNN
ncbi:MAG: hypothetical protein IJK99_01695 [Bacteroidales bacterium]|nr:hypothetical protein [Bacteroidales bacterium]